MRFNPHPLANGPFQHSGGAVVSHGTGLHMPDEDDCMPLPIDFAEPDPDDEGDEFNALPLLICGLVLLLLALVGLGAIVRFLTP